MNKDGWFHKKPKKYSYKGQVVMAVNKPHAAEKLGIKGYKETALIKRAKA